MGTDFYKITILSIDLDSCTLGYMSIQNIYVDHLVRVCVSELLNLVEYYKSVEAKIQEKMKGLPRHNKEHDCDSPLFISFIKLGKIKKYCLNCGGTKSD